MYILSQDKTKVYQMDELQTLGQFLVVTNASRKQKAVASYESSVDCKLAMRIIIGTMETAEKCTVIEAPERGQIAEVKAKLEEFKNECKKENAEASKVIDALTLDDLFKLIEQMVREEKTKRL